MLQFKKNFTWIKLQSQILFKARPHTLPALHYPVLAETHRCRGLELGVGVGVGVGCHSAEMASQRAPKRSGWPPGLRLSDAECQSAPDVTLLDVYVKGLAQSSVTGDP